MFVREFPAKFLPAHGEETSLTEAVQDSRGPHSQHTCLSAELTAVWVLGYHRGGLPGKNLHHIIHILASW